MKYEHGIYTPEQGTESENITVLTRFATVVIGTAPVHMAANPAAAVNTPILCRDMTDCKNKLGYSEEFEKYTVCQSMYTHFVLNKVAPVVFINVLDPSKHKKTTTDAEIAVKDKRAAIKDEVILSTLKLKNGDTEIAAEKYVAEYSSNSEVTINFTEEISGNITATYDAVDVTAVTAEDIIGAVNIETEERTGTELIKAIYPRLGVVPLILTAPGWSQNDTVGAVLKSKTTEINGCYKAHALIDLDSSKSKTRAAAITDKNARTLDSNCTALYPMVKKDNHIIYYSAMMSAVIMSQAAATDGITCKSPSNQSLDIDDCVLADGTSIYYDQEDGNELNAAGIVTIISRNGWYTWGNNTAGYPETTETKDRWIMSKLTFNYVENDFISSNFANIDGDLNRRMFEDAITDENIKLSAWALKGYIAGGTMSYELSDNPDRKILNGHFTFRTALASNIPGEKIENIFSFDVDTLKTVILGGTE